jgi:shikimate kinase
MKIILIGFMGAGKSTVAIELSSIFKLPIVEMDTLVLKKTGSRDMHEVFEKGSELLLRETEIAIAKEYGAIEQPSIISTGAGVVSNRIVLDYLKSRQGKVFFLNASFSTITDRLSHDVSRPLFQKIDEARSLYDFRQPLYLKYADHVIDSNDRFATEIAQEIAEMSQNIKGN